MPKFEDWEHKRKVEDYLEEYQLCPLELKTELNNSAQWEASAADTDIMAILLIMRDVMHNKKEQSQSTMGLAESFVALLLTQMKFKDTLGKYYCVFKAQVDMIEAHGGNPGYQCAVYRKHYKVIMVSKGHNTKAKLDGVGDTEIKR